MKDTFDYTDFSTPHENEVFHVMKLRQMRLAEACRFVLCDLIDGSSIGDGERSNKHFLNTYQGQFRIAMSNMSDNSSETLVHHQMGVTTIYANRREELMNFLNWHGVRITWTKYQARVAEELEVLEAEEIYAGS